MWKIKADSFSFTRALERRTFVIRVSRKHVYVLHFLHIESTMQNNWKPELSDRFQYKNWFIYWTKVSDNSWCHCLYSGRFLVYIDGNFFPISQRNKFYETLQHFTFSVILLDSILTKTQKEWWTTSNYLRLRRGHLEEYY